MSRGAQKRDFFAGSAKLSAFEYSNSRVHLQLQPPLPLSPVVSSGSEYLTNALCLPLTGGRAVAGLIL